MPVKNLYFSHGTRSEKFLYEDLMIEQLKVFGQEVIYLPREIVSKDDVLGDAISSKFESAFTIEMYVDNVTLRRTPRSINKIWFRSKRRCNIDRFEKTF